MFLPLRKIRMKLLTQIVLLITIVVLISMFLVNALFTFMIENIIEKNLGQQAMMVAKLAAENEDIIQGFEDQDPPRVIQPIAERIREVTGASYVVIGNREGIRYSHPNRSYIGKRMGTSNEAVFIERESIIYEGVGISGPAIKAKTPIWNAKGQLIGVSSVGFLLYDFERRVTEYKARIIALSILLLLIGVVGAILIARRVKKLIFGLEPEEISFIFKEKEATLESIRDAIVAVNMEHKVTSMNKRARELFQGDQLAIGGTIPNERVQDMLKEVIQKKEGQINQNMILGHQQYVLDFAPILEQNEVKGVVLTIRTVSEIEQLTDEVSKIKSFSDNMRAQNHEYLNKLNTIYGLLALKQYDKAMDMISGEVKERQDMIEFLMSSVKDPLIAACLLGKLNRSKELKVSLEIDQESHLVGVPQSIDSKVLVTILGNLIDNAMEAAKEKQGMNAVVKVSFTDLGLDLLFDVEDNGTGVPEVWEDSIFVEGFSTKSGENRGLGLAIVKNSLALLNGQIYIAKSHLGGARFTIAIPKGK
ncbi:ATP-binding protein [Ammoniphilus sp. 3BR4]|uniref:ATP-binding protein n=1 Tax=Ammoniphilus sp. 3BR4 TaxID=3158265 RepID=UPI0034652554